MATALVLLPGIAEASTTPGLIPGDYCNVRGDKREPWTAERKAMTRERVAAATRDLGVSAEIAAYHQLIVWRESFGGEASVRHSLGEDVLGQEDGLGAYGLSLRWHRDKWPGDDEDPAFCTPEVSTSVVHEIIWRAVTRYGARNLVEIQAVYAGAVRCRDGACRFTISPARRRGLCARATRRGLSCWAPITTRDLGRRLGDEERRSWALGMARRWVSRVLGRGSVLGVSA